MLLTLAICVSKFVYVHNVILPHFWKGRDLCKGFRVQSSMKYTLYMVHFEYGTLCMWYTLFFVHFLCGTLYLRYTFYVLQFVCCKLCLWYTFYVVHFVCGTLCMSYFIIRNSTNFDHSNLTLFLVTRWFL